MVHSICSEPRTYHIARRPDRPLLRDRSSATIAVFTIEVDGSAVEIALKRLADELPQARRGG